MSIARFRARGRFVRASKETEAEVVIDRKVGLFTVRPLRSKRLYTLPLSTVAEIVVSKCVKADLATKKKGK